MSGSQALRTEDLIYWAKSDKPKVTLADVQAYRELQNKRSEKEEQKQKHKDIAKTVRTWVLLIAGTASVVLALIPPVEPQYVALGCTLLAVEGAARS